MVNVEVEKDLPLLEGAVHQGKCWAAIRGEVAVSTIAMKAPSDADFESFRDSALETLGLLGEVRAGDLYEMRGDTYFMPRPHKHQNRSKKKPKSIIRPLRVSK